MKPITFHLGSLVAGLLILTAGACGGDVRRDVEQPEPGYIEAGLTAPSDTPEDQVVELPWWSVSRQAEKGSVRVLKPLRRYEVAEAGRALDHLGYPTLWFRAAGEGLADFTQKNLGEQIVLVTGGKVIGVGIVDAPLGGPCTLAGGMSEAAMNAALGHLIGDGTPNDRFVGY